MVRSAPPFRLRQNAPINRKESRKEPKKTKVQTTKNNNQSQTVTQNKSEGNSHGLLYPGGETACKALLSARICAAIWSHITDCDETYNYWEPMHYLVFGKGMQTWEYSPEYALRSYTYLMFHAMPAYLYHSLWQPNPLLIFYFTRCILGLMCSFAEVYFYKSVCREFGVHIGRMCLIFQIFSAGMFISSTAFLPSSFAMYTFLSACAAWWQQRYALAVFFTALGSLLGWPFAALLGVPIVFDMIFRKNLIRELIVWAFLSGFVIIIPMIFIDSMHYGKIVVAPFNLVRYNVLGGAGPELYGTEPFTFYLINGFLNFNFVWILALFTPIALILSHFFVPSKNKSTLYLPHWLSLSPMFLWIAVFFLQAHKEERFLFPIYPMICLCGAITLDILQKLCFRIWSLFKKMPPGTHYLDKTMFVMVTTLVITSLLGISRCFALYKNYHAPFDLLMELNRYPLEANVAPKSTVNVCVGKDWYRYPSSFFLPNTNWQLRFIKSEFDGMLPAPYSSAENATKLIPSHFNDQNKENDSLYFDINKCHFMLDLNTGVESDLEPIYANNRTKWKVFKSYEFLDAGKSNSFFRAFYVPYFGSPYLTFGNFSLLQSKLKIR